MPTCPECGSLMVNSVCDYVSHSKIIGDIMIPRVYMIKCSNRKCDYKVMGADSAKFVSRKVRDVELQAIRTLSFLEFTTIQEAARILHMRPYDLMERKHLFITRLSKNKHFFHKKSIELYAQKGDGRFNIPYTHSPLTNDEICKWENNRNLLNEIKANVEASATTPMRVAKTFAVSEDHPLNRI